MADSATRITVNDGQRTSWREASHSESLNQEQSPGFQTQLKVL